MKARQVLLDAARYCEEKLERVSRDQHVISDGTCADIFGVMFIVISTNAMNDIVAIGRAFRSKRAPNLRVFEGWIEDGDIYTIIDAIDRTLSETSASYVSGRGTRSLLSQTRVYSPDEAVPRAILAWNDKWRRTPSDIAKVLRGAAEHV